MKINLGYLQIQTGAAHDLIMYFMEWPVEGNEILSVRNVDLVSVRRHIMLLIHKNFHQDYMPVQHCGGCWSINFPIIRSSTIICLISAHYTLGHCPIILLSYWLVSHVAVNIFSKIKCRICSSVIINAT